MSSKLSHHLFALITLTMIFSAAQAAAILPLTPQPVKVELLSEGNAITPGFKFRTGVLFTIEPGWHIYWKNPGDAGLPTKLQFSAAGGLNLGEVLWPQHEEFELPGNIQGLGYSNKVLLFSEAVASDTLTPGTDQSIQAKVSWLACSPKLCVPGSQQLELKIAVKEVPDFSGKQLFDSWQSRVHT